MSGGIQHYEDSEAIQEHQGVPRQPYRRGEKGLWRRFLEAVLPGLKVKWAQGEMLLDAHVRQEMGKALQEEGRGQQEIVKAQLMEQKAQQLSEMVAKRETELEAEVDYTVVGSNEDLRQEIDGLQHELLMLRLKYSAHLAFSTGTTTELVEHALSQLFPEEAEMLRLHLGIGRDGRLSFEEIGQRFGVVPEEVERIVKYAASKVEKMGAKEG